MFRLPSPSRSLTLAATVSILALAPAMAADFTVPAGTTDTSSKTVAGADRGSIANGAELNTSGTAITQSGAAQDVRIENAGTLRSGNRGLDATGGSGTRTITFVNSGLAETDDDTFRVNTDVTQGTVTIDNSGVMRSDGGQVLDFASMRSGASRVELTNSGIMEAADNDAIRFGAGSTTLRNTGDILSTQSANRAINLNYAGNLPVFELYNDGRILSIDDAVRISEVPTLGNVLVENRGTIASRGTGDDAGQAIDFNGARAESIVIRNYGLIETADADAVRPGQGGMVENFGTIIGRAVDPNDSSDGIDFQDTNVGMVVNRTGGVVDGNRHGITGKLPMPILNEAGALIIGRNGSGINYDTLADQGPMVVTNYGEIVGAFNPDAEYGDGDGVDIDAIGEIYNYGTIRGLGSNGTKEGDLLPATSEAIAIGGGLVVNGSAEYRDALISGVDNGILVDDSDTGNAFAAISILNHGRIEGLDGFGIRIVSADANTIENHGTIAGSNGIAVEFGEGDDLFVHHDGASVEGTVNGAAGTDTFRLGGAAGRFDVSLLGEEATYRGFETVDVAAGSAWTLSGESAYAGEIRVANASLILADAGLSQSAVSLVDASLIGTGRLGSLDVARSQVAIASGESLAVAGDVAFDAGSSLLLDVQGRSGVLSAGGAVSIAEGASLVLTGTSGCATASPCTIVTSGAGIDGAFTLDNRLAFLGADVSYVGNDALLALSRNGVGFADVSETRNQRAVGTALDVLGSGAPLYDAVVGLGADDARGAFDALSGEAHASVKTGLVEVSNQVASVVGARLHASMSGPDSAFSTSGPGESVMPAYGGGIETWISAFGASGETDATGGTASLDRDTLGVLVGADALVGGNTRLGIFGGYSRSSFDVDARGFSADSDDIHVGVYAGTQLGGLSLRGGAAFGFHDIETERGVAFAGFADTLEAGTDARTTQVFGEVGYALAFGAVEFEPFAGLAYVDVDMDGFSETGGLAALSGGGDGFDATFSTLGLRAATALDLGGMDARLTGTLGWRHAFDDEAPVSTFAFDGGQAFTVAGAPIAQDAALVEVGFEVDLSPAATLGLSYAGQFGDDASQHGGRATLRFAF
ncbi:autotransporter outer membrane beta-barrel domain-containing protein [Aureimonas mangrovi]|uniref:autotransporter outer membrane beta-barrel domain-containing protein n=1 Tax=Aureimonas mangrovi TaxID=2758041 RepID=UPI00163D8DCB|nr:autotransporter domain-containing protein [Aureimonas mangrovi]